MTLDEALRSIVRDEVREAVAVAVAAIRDMREPAPTESVEFVSVRRAAELASVSTATIRRWLSAGKLPRYGAGGLVRIKVAELEQYLRPKPQVVNERAGRLLARLLTRGTNV